jgi:hypothetical protein
VADGKPVDVGNIFLSSCNAPYLKRLEELFAAGR